MADILLIEPDIKLGSIYGQFLTMSGHEVRLFSAAQSALTGIDQRQPDVIILELQLVAHNGIEFLYELRSYKDWQAIPVIVHSQVPPLLKAISPMLYDKLGITAYHYKPATKLRDLLRAIENLPIPV